MKQWCCNCAKFDYLIDNCNYPDRDVTRDTFICERFEDSNKKVEQARKKQLRRDYNQKQSGGRPW